MYATVTAVADVKAQQKTANGLCACQTTSNRRILPSVSAHCVLCDHAHRAAHTATATVRRLQLAACELP